jgi:hypothetical protein
MDLDHATNIAEMTAAVATVVTLIYLAVQIRTSNVITKSESAREFSSTQQPVWLSIVEDEKLSELFALGLAGAEGISGLDRMRFNILLSQLLNGFQRVHYNAEHGIAETSHLDEMHTAMRRFLDNPGGRGWWHEFGKDYPPAFQKYVNSKVLVKM